MSTQLTPEDDEFWDCKELLLDKMLQLADEFYLLMASQYQKTTARKYYNVACCFAYYIHDYTNHLAYKNILVGDANSRFQTKAKYQELYGWDSKEIKAKLKQFVLFLHENGLQNRKVLESLRK